MQNIFNNIAQINKGKNEPKRKFRRTPKKANLKSRKVKLGVADDLDSVLDTIEEVMGEASYYAYERFDEIIDKINEFKTEISGEVDNQIVNSNVSDADEMFRGYGADEFIRQLEMSADDLGIDVNSIEAYKRAMDLWVQYDETYREYEKKYLEVVSEAGFLAKFL